MNYSHSKLIILDRDGVINVDSDAFIKSPEEWNAIPGSLEAIAKLNQAGFTVAIASNQSGIGRGLFSLSQLDAIHKKMNQQLQAVGGHIDYLVFCPHHPDEGCACRKPATGLFLEIIQNFQLLPKDYSNIITIGDAWRDIEAAHALGLQAMLVLTGKGKKTFLEHRQELAAHKIYPCLLDAVNFMLRE